MQSAPLTDVNRKTPIVPAQGYSFAASAMPVFHGHRANRGWRLNGQGDRNPVSNRFAENQVEGSASRLRLLRDAGVSTNFIE
jgi:hypothetical protein